MMRPVVLRTFLASVTCSVVAGTLSGCSTPQEGPASIGSTDADYTVCLPADVDEQFLVGDTITVPEGALLKVTGIDFESEADVSVDTGFTFATADGHSYNLYSLPELKEEVPESWASRQALPTDGAVEVFTVDDSGTARAQATIGVIAQRTGSAAGVLGTMRVKYEIDGKAYETRNAMTYYLNNGPCIEEGGDWEDTDYGRSVNG